MEKIIINTIPHKDQAYDTVGNYSPAKNGGILFEISDMNNPDFELLVAVHELIEWYLTKKRGIPLKAIDDFDKSHLDADEPGNCKDAPYWKEHQEATGIERVLANILGVDWQEYDNSVTEL